MVKLEVICVFIFVFILFNILQSPHPSGERLLLGEKYLKGLAPCLAKVQQWLLKATHTVSALPQGGKGWQLSWKEEEYRAELQNQLQRWERKEVTWENVKDCQQLKIDHALPTDTSPPAQLHKPTPSQEQPSPELRPHRKPPPKKSKHSSEQAQPRLLAQLRKAGLPPRADSHVPPTEAQRHHLQQSPGPPVPRGRRQSKRHLVHPKACPNNFIPSESSPSPTSLSSPAPQAMPFLFLFYFIFWLCHKARGILVPWPEIKPAPLLLEAQSSSGLNH